MLIFEGKEISTDSEGYLKDTTLWSEPLAEKIADNEGLPLSAEHWAKQATKIAGLPKPVKCS